MSYMYSEYIWRDDSDNSTAIRTAIYYKMRMDSVVFFFLDFIRSPGYYFLDAFLNRDPIALGKLYYNTD